MAIQYGHSTAVYTSSTCVVLTCTGLITSILHNILLLLYNIAIYYNMAIIAIWPCIPTPSARVRTWPCVRTLVRELKYNTCTEYRYRVHGVHVYVHCVVHV